MSQNQVIAITASDKMKAFGELTKFRLSSLVVFSAAMTFLLAAKDNVDFFKLFALVLGGFLVTSFTHISGVVLQLQCSLCPVGPDALLSPQAGFGPVTVLP